MACRPIGLLWSRMDSPALAAKCTSVSASPDPTGAVRAAAVFQTSDTGSKMRDETPLTNELLLVACAARAGRLHRLPVKTALQGRLRSGSARHPGPVQRGGGSLQLPAYGHQREPAAAYRALYTAGSKCLYNAHLASTKASCVCPPTKMNSKHHCISMSIPMQ